uniref:myotubularin-related protein 9-like isoform X1 n=1 Tax=Styela clava TaxID=7725 RepID=UPI00193ADF5C|nr:myotubularin-related protein 9-like isoform X1 [Styela clava]
MKTMSENELSQTPKVEGVWCYNGQNKAISGTLCLTGHHMILYADDTSSGEIWIQYMNIDAVEKRIGLDKGTLVLRCKDLQQIQLTIPGVEDATNVAYTAEILSSITDPCLQFPFFYRAKFKYDENGWDLYNINDWYKELQSKTDKWRLSDVNSDFGVCTSYPNQIVVPSEIDDSMIQKSAKFRQAGRFPVLCYYHKNGASIIRSSQPLVGANNRRCKDDEKLLNAMLGPSHRGYILDIRSVQTAVQAKAKGGGYESDHQYPRWKRFTMNLYSYYVQQESLIRIVEASNDKSGSMDRWMSKLESSGWMGYIKRAMDAACLVAQCVDREEWSVLVHGAEGFDSTLTVTSLAQIILDSECRTIRGFLALIDREWIYSGHPFADRSAHGPYSSNKQRGESPVFSIFLECVFQLLHQFPLSFEFTSTLLVDLRMHSYSSQFGTFLFNHMRDRVRGKLHHKTISLWTYILSPAIFPKYINPLYKRRNDNIWPSVAPQSLEFWEELFTPWSTPRNEALERVKSLEAERIELEYLTTKLAKRVGNVPINEIQNLTIGQMDEKKVSNRKSAMKNEKLNKKKNENFVNENAAMNGPKLLDFTEFPRPEKFEDLVSDEKSNNYYMPIDAPQHFSNDTDIPNGLPLQRPNLLDDLAAFVNPSSSQELPEKVETNSSKESPLIDFDHFSVPNSENSTDSAQQSSEPSLINIDEDFSNEKIETDPILSNSNSLNDLYESPI